MLFVGVNTTSGSDSKYFFFILILLCLLRTVLSWKLIFKEKFSDSGTIKEQFIVPEH